MVFGNFESAFSADKLEQLLLLLPVLIISMTLHEMAHGYVANRLGDPTARMLGRLSPNPIRHVDPMGSAMFGLSWLASGGTFLFGWAKPIPVQPRFFNHPQRDFAIVAIAGPLTNILIAFLLALPLAHVPLGDGIWADALVLAFFMNIWLAVFNMLPIPPLDGSRVIAAIMPREMAESWSRLDQYGFIILMGAILFFRPLFEIIGAIADPIARFLFTIAGG